MTIGVPHTVVYAPAVEHQIDQALTWWSANRRKAPLLLARELDRALELVAIAPQVGQRARTRRFGDLRRVLLPKSEYQLYYRVLEAERLVQLLLFRHARRRPLR